MPELAVDTRVNVWCLPLLWWLEGSPSASRSRAGDDVELQRITAMLSPEEKAVAAAFDSLERRRSYVAAHALLRSILAKVTGVAPNEIVFRYGQRGKPELAAPVQHNLQFNMSHSRDVMVVAVTTGRRVGVDIEHIDEPGDVRRIAARFLSPRDRDAIEQLPAERQRYAFLRCWTRKEAYMKARGDGVSRPLDDFELTPAADTNPAQFKVTRRDAESDDWQLADVPVPRGFLAAVAVEGPAFEVVQHYAWTFDA